MESVNSASECSFDPSVSSTISEAVDVSVAEIEVNLLLPPDEELRTIHLPVTGTVLDALIAAEKIDRDLIISDHFAHIYEDETELSPDTLLSALPEPRDLCICRRLSVSDSSVQCESPISDFHSPEVSELQRESEVNEVKDSLELASLPLKESEPQLDSPVISSSRRVRRYSPSPLPPGYSPRPLNYGTLLRQLQSATLLDIHMCRQYLNHYQYDFKLALAALRSRYTT
jgi:hypothetical protein